MTERIEALEKRIAAVEEAIQQLQSNGVELLTKKLTEAAILGSKEVMK